MTSSSTWKALERMAAKELGGARIPCSGNGGIQGDVLHDKYFIECKLRQGFVAQKWYDKAKKESKGKKPVLLVVKSKGRHNTFVMMDIEDFKRLMGD